MNMLEREFGWRCYGAKHFGALNTLFFQGYISSRKFGYDKYRSHLSCLVCTGDHPFLNLLDSLQQLFKRVAAQD